MPVGKCRLEKSLRIRVSPTLHKPREHSQKNSLLRSKSSVTREPFSITCVGRRTGVLPRRWSSLLPSSPLFSQPSLSRSGSFGIRGSTLPSQEHLKRHKGIYTLDALTFGAKGCSRGKSLKPG